MVPRNVGQDNIIYAHHSIPELRPKIFLVLKQKLGMPIGIGVGSRICRMLTHPILTPNNKGPGSLFWINGAGIVG